MLWSHLGSKKINIRKKQTEIRWSSLKPISIGSFHFSRTLKRLFSVDLSGGPQLLLVLVCFLVSVAKAGAAFFVVDQLVVDEHAKNEENKADEVEVGKLLPADSQSESPNEQRPQRIEHHPIETNSQFKNRF